MNLTAGARRDKREEKGNLSLEREPRMGLLMILFWVALVVAVVLLLKKGKGNRE